MTTDKERNKEIDTINNNNFFDMETDIKSINQSIFIFFFYQDLPN